MSQKKIQQTLPSDLQPYLLLSGYCRGIFPMAENRHSDTHHWYRPDVRGILPIFDFHVAKNLKRLLNKVKCEIRIDSDFAGTMRACAERDETWISDVLIAAYNQLHELGYAHSVEVWEGNEMTGGLYGVSIGGVFFGESMFQKQSDRAKIALFHCSSHLAARGFQLWDTQYYTEHLGTFGCYEMQRAEYEKELHKALFKRVWFGAKEPQKLSLPQPESD